MLHSGEVEYLVNLLDKQIIKLRDQRDNFYSFQVDYNLRIKEIYDEIDYIHQIKMKLKGEWK